MSEEEIQQINRVAVKLPPFWSDKPSLWFSQADSQFLISGITSDDTKFHYIVAQLETRYAAEVEDIITNPPDTEKYKTLRSKLIERLSASEEQRVRQIISEEELGERKPSQFLRHLRSLAGSSSLQDNLLRQLWLRRLPAQAQAILTTQLDLSLDKLADLADKVVEVSRPAVFSLASGNLKSSGDSGNAALNAIETKFAELSKQVAELSVNFRQNERATSKSRSRSSSRTKTDDKVKRLCWYHHKFGNKALKCVTPCDFQGNSKSNH